MATYTDNYNLIKPSYADVADVATINTNMNTIDDIMHSSQVSLAPAYDATQTYNTDDVVMYEFLMYKCTDDNVTGVWDASKWTRTTASEVGSISVADMTGATASVAGTHGLVPAPSAGDNTKFLRGDGTWQTVQSGGGGGSGSAITYGYGGAPSVAGNDGDLHIVLSSNDKKKGEYLYMTNQWVLIDGSGETSLELYDNGTEGVSWSVTGGTKNVDNISLTVGAGTFTNYAITDTAIDITDYSQLVVVCRYRDVDYTKTIDISTLTGNKYISFLYVTNSSYNECAVGLTDTASPAATYQVDRRNGGTAECIMYSCTLE